MPKLKIKLKSFANEEVALYATQAAQEAIPGFTGIIKEKRNNSGELVSISIDYPKGVPKDELKAAKALIEELTHVTSVSAFPIDDTEDFEDAQYAVGEGPWTNVNFPMNDGDHKLGVIQGMEAGGTGEANTGAQCVRSGELNGVAELVPGVNYLHYTNNNQLQIRSNQTTAISLFEAFELGFDVKINDTRDGTTCQLGDVSLGNRHSLIVNIPTSSGDYYFEMHAGEGLYSGGWYCYVRKVGGATGTPVVMTAQTNTFNRVTIKQGMDGLLSLTIGSQVAVLDINDVPSTLEVIRILPNSRINHSSATAPSPSKPLIVDNLHINVLSGEEA